MTNTVWTHKTCVCLGTLSLLHGPIAVSAERLHTSDPPLHFVSNTSASKENRGKSVVPPPAANSQVPVGRSEMAAQTLEDALKVAERSGEPRRIAIAAGKLGSHHLYAGEWDRALEFLHMGLTLALEHGDGAVAAAALTDLGNLYVKKGRHAEVLRFFIEASHLARDAGHPVSTIRATTNAAVVAIMVGDDLLAYELAHTARRELPSVDRDSPDFALLHVRIGQVFTRLVSRLRDRRENIVALASESLGAGRVAAKKTNDGWIVSYALGVTGGFYLEIGDYDNALRTTRAAAFAAQASQAHDLLYRWQWQVGRILAARGDMSDAVNAYRRAHAAHRQLGGGGPSLVVESGVLFSEAPGALHYEFADLLLRQTDTVSNPAKLDAMLREARDAVEGVKAAELQDYFQDDCVALARQEIKKLEQAISADTVVLYPIQFSDRLELLISHASGLKRYRTKVSSEMVRAVADRFRRQVERARTREYLADAQQLYDWIIRPMESELTSRQITTLVAVPDPVLRSIPLAALHDGERFLIEKVAVAIAPGLELTDPRPLPRHGMKLLLSGLTQPVHDYPALVHVESELEGIRALHGGTLVLNEAFNNSVIERELVKQVYTVAHLASHGQFTGDSMSSFIVTYDGKVTVGDLTRYIGYNRFRDTPLELLTLSACQTAAGDARAALGLAGITVKAGARSALATLWPINDRATASLMTEFYAALKDHTVSKAHALQRAQRQMLSDVRTRHPGYWSAFILIGNWQ